MSTLADEAARRRTFAIISHPDAGKTTLTEKLLLFGGAIQLAGTVKGRKAARHATSDWMELEKQRGISVTSSVMASVTKRTVRLKKSSPTMVSSERRSCLTGPQSSAPLEIRYRNDSKTAAEKMTMVSNRVS